MASTKKNKNILKAAILAAVGGAGLLLLVQLLPLATDSAPKGKSFTIQEGETRPVLDPGLFFGDVRDAYALAQKYPQVLDQVFCYCSCDDPPFHHKSLLSCFVDTHGAG